MTLALASAAFSGRASAPFVICCEGDSVTEGTGVSGNTPGTSLAYQDRWINKMIKRLQLNNLGGVAGGIGGFGTDVQDLTGSNPWSNAPQSEQSRWPGFRAGVFGATRVSQCVLPPGTSIDVFGWQGSAATVPWTVTINGTATTVTPSTTGGLIDNFKQNITGGMTTGGNNTVVFTGNAGAICYPDGLIHYNGDETKGIRLIDAGHYGQTTSSYGADLVSNNDNNHYAARMPQLGISLFIVCLSLNDYQNQLAINTFTSNMNTIVTANKGYAANASHILISPWQRTDIGAQAIPMTSYRDAIAGIAAGDPANIAYLDMQPTWDANGGTAALCTDGVHPTNAGHALMGQTVADFVLSELEALGGFFRRR